MKCMQFRAMTKVLAVSCAVAALAGAAPAIAGTATSTFQVTATVQSSCTVSAAAMSFGTYSLAAGNTGQSQITVTCTNGTNAQVALDAGQNGGKASTYGSRAMTAGGSNYLGYDIYTSTAYTTVWNASNTQNVQSSGSPVTLTAYGKLPAGQGVTTGNYTDTVTVTATF